LMSPTVSGPVCRQAIEEFDGSTNQFPFESLSISPRLKRPIWQVTPRTLGSATASTTIVLPVQSLRNWPISSAEAGDIMARRARQIVSGRRTRSMFMVARRKIIDLHQCGFLNLGKLHAHGFFEDIRRCAYRGPVHPKSQTRYHRWGCCQRESGEASVAVRQQSAEKADAT